MEDKVKFFKSYIEAYESMYPKTNEDKAKIYATNPSYFTIGAQMYNLAKTELESMSLKGFLDNIKEK